MNSLPNLLKKALNDHGIAASEEQQAKWIRYLDALVTWNKVYNLTNITEPREMVYLHLIDSLLVAPFIHGTHCLDVGSGAGLPGIPLAILSPTQQWTLLDKNSKKTRFMFQMVAELSLKNVTVVHQRGEAFQPTIPFDTIISRAYASLALFVETTEHALAPGGRLVAMKGKYPDDEIAALPQHIHLTTAKALTMKGMPLDRHVICLEKTIS